MGKWLRRDLLLVLTIIGVIMGFVLGIAVRPAKPSPDVIELLIFPGELLLRMLKMLILPLIFSSLIVGTSSMSCTALGNFN